MRAEGKLVFIKVGFNQVNKESAILNHKPILVDSITQIKPIIFSEIEKIEVGDWVYDRAGHQGRYLKQFDALAKDGGDCSDHCVKVLVLPEQFSHKHLQAIVDGKMKDGDKILVECENWFKKNDKYQLVEIKQIKLNSEGHAILHEVEEKKFTLDNLKAAFKAGQMHIATEGKIYGQSPNFDEWFEQKIK